MTHKIETWTFDVDTSTVARCSTAGCEWVKDAITNYEGRNVRSSARSHVARKGHTVIVHVERLSASEFRPVQP